MKLKFETENVEAQTTSGGTDFVGFYTEENYLVFQRRDDLGDVYYVERDDQSYSCYGGVERIELTPSSISVTLDEVGQNRLECESVSVDFSAEPETFESMKAMLAKMVGERLAVTE